MRENLKDFLFPFSLDKSMKILGKKKYTTQ